VAPDPPAARPTERRAQQRPGVGPHDKAPTARALLRPRPHSIAPKPGRTVLNAAQGNTNFGLNRRASLRPYLRGAEGEIPSAYSPICFSAKPICVASAALRERFGETGVIVAAAVAGFVDTHSVAISIASLVASGR
jgi:hypothetical protein